MSDESQKFFRYTVYQSVPHGMLIVCYGTWLFNTLRPKQNGRHFPDDISKCIFLNENVWFRLRFHWSLFLRFEWMDGYRHIAREVILHNNSSVDGFVNRNSYLLLRICICWVLYSLQPPKDQQSVGLKSYPAIRASVFPIWPHDRTSKVITASSSGGLLLTTECDSWVWSELWIKLGTFLKAFESSQLIEAKWHIYASVNLPSLFR